MFFSSSHANANDSHSISKKLSKYMRVAKTGFHLIDDPAVATEKALNITDPTFMLAADTIVASVFFIVTAIELHEAIHELDEINKEYAELKAMDEETTRKKQHLEKRRNICRLNVALCEGALIASSILLFCTVASLSFVGMGVFPFAIMMTILVKQCNEFYMLNDELNELRAINQPTQEQQKKIAEIENTLFFKKREIIAQALITFGFFASVVTVSVFSMGSVPIALVIGGAILGLIFKIYEKYHDNKMEKAELREKADAESAKARNAELRVQTANASVQELTQQNTELKTKNAHLTNRTAEMEAKINAHAEELEKTKREYAKLHAENEQLKAEREAKSTSNCRFFGLPLKHSDSYSSAAQLIRLGA